MRMEIYSANSVLNAGDLVLVVRTYWKGKLGVRPSRRNVRWTPTSTLTVDSNLSGHERDKPSEGSDEGKGTLHF